MKKNAQKTPSNSVARLADLFDRTKWGLLFSREEIELIAGYLSYHDYKKGSYIFKQGDRQQFMAFIAEGSINILKEGSDNVEKFLVTLYTGTHFGEMSLVDGEPRSASAVAGEDSALLFLTRSNLDCMLECNPKVGVKILMEVAKLISKRLRMTTGKLVT